MATIYIDVNELPARFTEAVGWAERNDTVLITRDGKAVIRLVPDRPPESRTKRVLGMHAGTTMLPDDFNDPSAYEEVPADAMP